MPLRTLEAYVSISESSFDSGLPELMGLDSPIPGDGAATFGVLVRSSSFSLSMTGGVFFVITGFPPDEFELWAMSSAITVTRMMITAEPTAMTGPLNQDWFAVVGFAGVRLAPERCTPEACVPRVPASSWL